ncbi:MAG: SpoIIE family protein phosphatase [Bacteroidales bacterium]|nr:SpoIIE family protein phosphatase [Bacteroidales bacterium]
MAKIKKISILILFLTIHLFVYSQSQHGLPEITNYFDINNKYKSDQVWDIKQSPDGLMYFAATNYFIEFDGQNWIEFFESAGSTYHSFDIDSSTRNFFIGAKNNLLSSNLVNGKYQTDDIVIPEYLSSTWKTFFCNGKTYFFINKKDIIVFDNNSIEIVHRPSNFEITRGFKVNNIIYAISPKGIASVNDSEISIISTKKESIYTQDIRTILKFSDSTLLIGTKEGNLYIFNPKTDHFTPFKTDADDLLHYGQIYNGIRINDSVFAIATLKSGFIILNNKGEEILTLDKKTGLLSNAIYCAYIDKNKNIWLGTGMGVSVVYLGSSLRYFDKRQKIDDMLTATAIFFDKLIVGTSEGFFYLDFDQPQDQSFKPTQRQILYSSSIIQSKIRNSEYLIASEYEGVSAFDKNLDFKNNIEIPGSRKILKSPTKNDRIFVANYNELVAVKLQENSNNLEFIIEKQFFELPFNIDNLVFDNKNNLWICQAKNLFMIDFDVNESLNNYTVFFFDEVSGLPDAKIYNVFEIKTDLFVSTAEGLYKLKDRNAPTKNYVFVKYSDSLICAIQDFIIISKVEYKNYLFFLTNNSICRIDTINNSTEKLVFGEIFDHYNTELYIQDDLLWTHSKEKVICIDPILFNQQTQIESNFILRSVKIGESPAHAIYSSDSIVEISENTYNIITKISQKENHLSLTFALPYYLHNEKIEYSFQTLNKDTEWEEIKIGNTLSLRHLTPGKYTILIKSRNFYQNESNIITVNFTVKENFYFSKIAIVIYLLIITLVILAFVYFRNNNIRKENSKLGHIVKTRTEELEQQKEELIMQSQHLLEQKRLLKKESERLDLATIELKQLSLVAKKTDNSVLILEKTGKIEWWNRGFTDLFAFKIEQFKDMSFRVAYRKIRPDIFKEINSYTEDKGTISYTNHEVFDNGEEIWYQTTINPVFDDNEELFKFVVIDINISDIKSAEQEILEQKVALKNYNEKQSKLSADLSITNEQLKNISKFDKSNQIYAGFLYDFFTIHTLNFGTQINHFLFNKPQDQISGDFIWSTKYKNNNLIAIGDSTGHKVRGSIVSVLAISLLKEILIDNTELVLSKILELFYKKFNDLLNFSEELKNQDSVDIALAMIDIKNQKLDFCGAKIPLHLVRKEHQYNLYTFEADRIKINSQNNTFTDQFTALKNKDRIYITTDGWINQFGKFGQKKYSGQKFKKFVLSIQNHPIENQSNEFYKEFHSWKGNFEQIDDILIFGAEIIFE